MVCAAVVVDPGQATLRLRQEHTRGHVHTHAHSRKIQFANPRAELGR